jgi:hypothetical protein
MKLTIDIPEIPEEEKSELVVLLLEIIRSYVPQYLTQPVP